MDDTTQFPVDVAIIGGGIAGLWLLDQLVRHGYAALLLESTALGSSQTVASQGIIHGGLKYMFDGRLSAPAKAISEMPVIWRQALAGQRQPDLSAATVRSDCCHIWGTGSIKSRIFIKGSTIALRAAPEPIDRSQAPAALAGVPGTILRVPEQVIDPASLARVFLDRNAGRILHAEAVEFIASGQPQLRVSSRGRILTINPTHIILTAGAGNADLRAQLGLSPNAMQRRPLQMVMLRGKLPELFGHCVGGPKPRITITSAPNAAGQMVWQIGGQIAEDGVAMDPAQLKQRTREELAACLPGVALDGIEFASYRIDRAEAATRAGQRPDDVHVMCEGNTMAAWPTKLALAPRLAERILELLQPPAAGMTTGPIEFPVPPIALPPWETATHWEPLL